MATMRRTYNYSCNLHSNQLIFRNMNRERFNMQGSAARRQWRDGYNMDVFVPDPTGALYQDELDDVNDDDLIPQSLDDFWNAFPDCPGPFRLMGWERIGDPWESTILRVRHGVGNRGRSETLIFKIYKDNDALDKCRIENTALICFGETEVPVPEPVYCCDDASLSPWGTPVLVMKGQNSETCMTLQELLEYYPARRTEYISLMAKLQFMIHDPNSAARHWDRSWAATFNDPKFLIHSMDRRIANLKPPHVANTQIFEKMFLWLRSRAKHVRPIPGLTHGDFVPSNIMQYDGRSMCIIDWTSFAVDDIRFDLGWTIMMFRTENLLQEYKDLVDIYLKEYRHLWEPTIKDSDLDYFVAFACTKRLLQFFKIHLMSPDDRISHDLEDLYTSMKNLMRHWNAVYRLLAEKAKLSLVEVERHLKNLLSFIYNARAQTTFNLMHLLAVHL
ncbi:kinase-like domain-containing protein [Endogone sp. FLAS-F59071]|nr:kinase-like domain-containing protein [Endogone sp. FLAS-F59071]|eukprot:RUS22092.1 kinase-like domain-containing protein [Endogone sp. FLAS-F59071]